MPGRVWSRLASSLHPEPSTRPAGASIAVLRNVLRLEEQRGFDDRAVVGGVASFVARSAVGDALPAELRAAVERYPSTANVERAATLRALEAVLDAMERRETPTGPGTRSELPA
ncbi:MAG: hypothetical protein QOF51_3959, partial [Chloroflexota bacterium]|nr:hypothetical protein [Chloroflexota bacterium]